MSTETQTSSTPDFGNIFDKIPANFSGAVPIVETPDNKGGTPPVPPVTKPPVEKEPSGSATPQEPDVVEPTTEEIQAKLTELEGKNEAELTEEEKAFITQYTEDTSAISSVKSFFKEKYGMEIEDKGYEDSPQGIAQVVDDVVPIMANAMLEEHFGSVPLMAEFYNHVVKEGKSIETFMLKNTEPEYKKLELKETSADMDEASNKKLVTNQKELIKMNYLSKGVDADMIEKIIELAELNGNLFAEAVKSRDALKATHAKVVENNIKAEEAKLAAEEQQKVAAANEFRKMLQKNEFNGKSINPAHVKGFEKAVLEVDERGKSILDYKLEKLSFADRMYLNYLVLQDFKVGQYTKPVTQNKKFDFGKKAEANDSRNGGRLRGTGASLGSDSSKKLDIGEFLNGVLNNKKA